MDKYGSNALHIASEHGYVGIVRMLLAAGVQINATDKEGCTALHIAVSEGHEEMVHLLVQVGVDVNVQDRDGLTAYQIASVATIKHYLRAHLPQQRHRHRSNNNNSKNSGLRIECGEEVEEEGGYDGSTITTNQSFEREAEAEETANEEEQEDQALQQQILRQERREDVVIIHGAEIPISEAQEFLQYSLMTDLSIQVEQMSDSLQTVQDCVDNQGNDMQTLKEEVSTLQTTLQEIVVWMKAQQQQQQQQTQVQHQPQPQRKEYICVREY